MLRARAQYRHHASISDTISRAEFSFAFFAFYVFRHDDTIGRYATHGERSRVPDTTISLIHHLKLGFGQTPLILLYMQPISLLSTTRVSRFLRRCPFPARRAKRENDALCHRRSQPRFISVIPCRRSFMHEFQRRMTKVHAPMLCKTGREGRRFFRLLIWIAAWVLMPLILIRHRQRKATLGSRFIARKVPNIRRATYHLPSSDASLQ